MSQHRIKKYAPSPAAIAVVAAWPGDDWLTEDAVATLLADELGKRRVRPVLNEARRRSWLIRDQRQEPAVWCRTKTGRAAAAELQEATR